MNLQPQDWTRLADIKAVQVPRVKQRPAHPIAALHAVGPGAPPAGSTPTPATAPLGRARSAAPLVVALPALMALAGCWLMAGDDGHALRGLLLGAGAALALLLPVTLHFARREAACAAEAVRSAQQVANIMGCLREGVFSIGRDLRLSEICSASMGEILHLAAPAGRRFEEVLRPLLDEHTVSAALTFLQLLWNDQADADAIASLNPLGQVEVCFANTHGGNERRYLSFSFRRVTGTRRAEDCIVGMVADVTDRVLLARALEQAEAEGESQTELLLQLVRADPIALVAFLDDADTAFRKSNALLTATGAGQLHLQKKLSGVLRELAAVTAEAEALSFGSFTHRLHCIDEVLSPLCEKSSLTGNDFLPVVVGLDELMSHAATMRTIYQHIVLLRAASAALAALDHNNETVGSEPLVLRVS